MLLALSIIFERGIIFMTASVLYSQYALKHYAQDLKYNILTVLG
jgi:hypothetical protein